MHFAPLGLGPPLFACGCGCGCGWVAVDAGLWPSGRPPLPIEEVVSVAVVGDAAAADYCQRQTSAE